MIEIEMIVMTTQFKGLARLMPDSWKRHKVAVHGNGRILAVDDVLRGVGMTFAGDSGVTDPEKRGA